MKKVAFLFAVVILMTSVVFTASAATIKDIAGEAATATLNSQNAGATTVTSEDGVVKFTTSTWDGLTFTCWGDSPNFTPVALPENSYLNIVFKYTGTGTVRISLDFNEGKALIANLVKDDFSTISSADNGYQAFAEGEYKISLPLSELGLTATDGNLTMTGWILNITLGTVEFSSFSVDSEPLTDDKPTVSEPETSNEESVAADDESVAESTTSEASNETNPGTGEFSYVVVILAALVAASVAVVIRKRRA